LNFLATVVFLAVFFFAAATFFDADFLAFLIAMNSPVVLSRFVQVEAPPMVVLVWLRFFTAPFRALSPVGLFFAIRVLPNIAPQSKNPVQPNKFRNESPERSLIPPSVALESSMRPYLWTPSFVPSIGDQYVYLVLDCFDRSGRAWRVADAGETDLETVIRDLMSGQYNDPQRVIAFNTFEHWADDVSEDVAREIRRRADAAHEDLSSSIEDFVIRHAGREQQLYSRLA
jgi:hypothetical protein